MTSLEAILLEIYSYNGDLGWPDSLWSTVDLNSQALAGRDLRRCLHRVCCSGKANLAKGAYPIRKSQSAASMVPACAK